MSEQKSPWNITLEDVASVMGPKFATPTKLNPEVQPNLWSQIVCLEASRANGVCYTDVQLGDDPGSSVVTITVPVERESEVVIPPRCQNSRVIVQRGRITLFSPNSTNPAAPSQASQVKQDTEARLIP